MVAGINSIPAELKALLLACCESGLHFCPVGGMPTECAALCV